MVIPATRREPGIVVKPVPSLRVVVRISVPQVARSSFFAPAIGLFTAAVFAAGLASWNLRREPLPVTTIGVDAEHALLPSPLPRPPRRIVYRYSIVPGGVASPTEALQAAAHDSIVHSHYKGFDLRRASMVDNPSDLFLHVSYRKGSSVYWTRDKVRIPAGERLLTDGARFIRARCGNRLAVLPQGDVEPAHQAVSQRLLDEPLIEEEPSDQSPFGPFAGILPATQLLDPVPSSIESSLNPASADLTSQAASSGPYSIFPGVWAAPGIIAKPNPPAAPAGPSPAPGAPVGTPEPPTPNLSPPSTQNPGGSAPPGGSFPPGSSAADPEETAPYRLPSLRPGRNTSVPTPGPEPENPGSNPIDPPADPAGPGEPSFERDGPVIPGIDIPSDLTDPQEGDDPSSDDPTAPVPEPATAALVAAGLLAAWLRYRRRV